MPRDIQWEGLVSIKTMSSSFTHSFLRMLKKGPYSSVNFPCSFLPTSSSIPSLHVESKLSGGWSLNRGEIITLNPLDKWAVICCSEPAGLDSVRGHKGPQWGVVTRCWLSTSRKRSCLSFGRSSWKSIGRRKGEWKDLNQNWTPKPLTLTANRQNRHFTDEKT